MKSVRAVTVSFLRAHFFPHPACSGHYVAWLSLLLSNFMKALTCLSSFVWGPAIIQIFQGPMRSPSVFRKA